MFTRSWMILQSWGPPCAKDKFPDWSKILEAGAAAGADAMSGGIGKVTSQIGNAITDLDSQVGCHCWGLRPDWERNLVGNFSVILRKIEAGMFYPVAVKGANCGELGSQLELQIDFPTHRDAKRNFMRFNHQWCGFMGF